MHSTLATHSLTGAPSSLCRRCGRTPRLGLTHFPCSHRFCGRCLECIVDGDFRDIEGLDRSLCPRCKTPRPGT
ncbi:hypothetical protein GN956_G9547 [Arapaima gigas]